jgi:hypothetical protein
LNSSQYGYKLNERTNVMLTNLLYIDDLKLFASTPEKLHSLISLVQKFSEDINMTFGTSKCAIIHINKGKFIHGTQYQLKQNNFIWCLEENQTYKYLGIQQDYRVNQTQLKAQFRDKYIERLKLVFKIKLNAKNNTTAINSWATPVLAYTFGVIDWSDTDLESLNRKTRVLLMKYRNHHPKACTERL